MANLLEISRGTPPPKILVLTRCQRYLSTPYVQERFICCQRYLSTPYVQERFICCQRYLSVPYLQEALYGQFTGDISRDTSA